MPSLADVQNIAAREGWLEGPVVSGLYLSAGGDTQPMALLHPEFLAQQGAREAQPPNFFAYADAERPGDGEDRKLRFEDDRTQIETLDLRQVEVAGREGHLLRVHLDSDTLAPRDIAVLRLRMTNDEFTELALAGSWSPEWILSVCDGCGAFGGNHRCESDLSLGPDVLIPYRLGAKYWVTDHFWRSNAPATREGGSEDLVDGGVIEQVDAAAPYIRLRQRCFLSSKWRSNVSDAVRLFGGPRVFEIERL